MPGPAAPDPSRTARRITTVLAALYIPLSLSGLQGLRRGSEGYPLPNILTDLGFTALTVVLLVGLWRGRWWGSIGLALLAGARLAGRLGGVLRDGGTDLGLPGPIWTLRLLLLAGIVVFALRARPRATAATSG
ncbi:MAG: hypothetical protein KA180_10485 [Gemmatimonadales bacterium]|jgi:hypothetical protein|nr:hypothetical protein [Gemmatimonadota bacterium]MBP6669861.1 hypothetical protein [Gemmatimonadales bacterium]MBK7350030.1 hypothetical protein [Gemmatimonadota bacterium]MBK7784658.1 hypothetical protein [Gemmatimonadota bacterium]MBK9066336.1 hypothetical protein [Gemmatimonadota bacterium]